MNKKHIIIGLSITIVIIAIAFVAISHGGLTGEDLVNTHGHTH
ncbi:MAG: hypothetical protein ACRBB3_07895 [Alphaproteobacteria bacterium]